MNFGSNSENLTTTWSHLINKRLISQQANNKTKMQPRIICPVSNKMSHILIILGREHIKKVLESSQGQDKNLIFGDNPITHLVSKVPREVERENLPPNIWLSNFPK